MTHPGGDRASLDDDIRSDEYDDRRRRGYGGDPTFLWALLRWRAKRIGTVALATVLLAAIILAILPADYKATTIVLVDPRQPHVTKNEAVLPGIGADAAFVESQVEVIESTMLARKVIDLLDLKHDPEFAKPGLLETLLDSVRRALGTSSETDPAVSAAKIEKRFLDKLSARRRGLTYNIEINFVSKDPAKAARIANALAEGYINDQQLARIEVTARASNWLQTRIDELRTRVRESDRAVAAYKAAHNLIDVTQGNKLIQRQIEDLTQQLALARSRVAEASGRLERTLKASRYAGNPNTLTEALQSPVIAALRAQYAEATRLQAQQRTIYGDKSPELIAVRAQLADLQRQIEAELARIVQGIRNDYQVAKDREATLQAELERLKVQSGSLNNADVELRQLEREAEANKTLFEEFLNRAKETNEQRTLQIADVRVISPASVPLRPSRPPALFLLLAAGIAGIIGGIGLVLAQERLRRGFRTSREIEQTLGLPTLGILPEQATATGWIARKLSAAAAVAGRARFALDQPSSPYAGNLRAIRTKLRRSAPYPAHEVLAVVSALSGEGKTTFACNLALTSAMAGMRTLLIDADIHVSAAARAFALDEAKLDEAPEGKLPYRSAVRKNPETGLHVLALRDLLRAQTLSDDMLAAALAEVIKDWREQFDLTIIDCPAALQCTESIDLVGSADRAVLVVKWDETERRAAADVLAALGPLSRKLAGVVLNMVPVKWWRMFESGRYLDYGQAGGRVLEAAPTASAVTGSTRPDDFLGTSRSVLMQGRAFAVARDPRPKGFDRTRSLR